ncbi:ATP-binding protein [Bacteriovoracales bacterium]|nr:ATP-binding protein [Bacteriovoracales bacterium]
MSNINQDLQATHKILTIIEQSKSNNDELLDHLPGIFCIIDDEARVLRGNLELASIFKIDLEDLIEKDFSSIFNKEIWNIFKKNLDSLSTKDNKEFQFELEISNDDDGESRSFYWYISPFSSGKDNSKAFYSIVGEDISELRKKEKQLMEIFSSIPLGILTIGPNKKIEPQYSQFTEYLLDNKELSGHDLEKTIFKETLENCEPETREGISNIIGSIGENDLIFESLKSTFPNKIWYPIKDNLDGGRWIGLTYQPVVYGGVVKRILVICEDRTKIIQSEEALKDSQLLEDKSIARILQIKKSDQSMLPLFVKEINELVEKLGPLYKEENSKEICNVLHGVKGNARVAGFDFLTSLSHDLESFILDKNKSENASKWKDIGNNISEIKSEWKEISSLHRSLVSTNDVANDSSVDSDVAELFDRYSKMLNASSFSEDPIKTERMMLAIKSINFSSIEGMNQNIKLKAEKTCEALGKKVEVHFDWNNIILEDYTKSSLSESLLHLVTNGISHGIENPERRKELGKPEEGQINIKAREKDGMIFLDVHDDGAGISFSSIVRTAVKRKIITLEKVTQISRSELLKLVFEPGFSTAEELTDISGRGVGMDVVAERVKELGGDITLDTKEGKGTRFSMSMRTGKKTEVNRSVVSLSRFKSLLIKNLELLGKEKNVDLEFENLKDDKSLDKGMIYCDMPRLTLAVTTYLGSFLKEGGKYKLKVFRESNKFYIDGACLEEGDDKSKWAEFTKPLAFCFDYLKKHKGEIREDKESMQVSFGHILGPTDIPDLHVAFEKGISEEDAKITTDRILSIKEELDLTLEINLKPDRYTNLFVMSNPSENKELSLTLGASKASIQKELRKKVESIVSAIDRF